MKLLWLTVNCSYSHSSLALPLLHNACTTDSAYPLLRQAIQWDTIEALTQDSPFDIAAAIAQRAPDILAAPLYIFNRTAVLESLARAKVLLPDLRIIVGGPECLREGASEILHACPYIDVAFSGEGEDTYPIVLDALLNGRLPAEGNGIHIQGGQATPQPPAVFAAWATAPAPVTSPFFRTDKPFVQVETSRGCPFGCQYCTSANTSLRYRPLDQVKEELARLHAKGIREVRLLDRTFNAPESRAVQLLQMFRNDFPQMHFHLEIHPQFLTPALRTELRQAKPRQLHIEAGIQTLHNDVLKAVGRLPHAEEALDGLQFLISCHPLFDTHCDLLAGLPEQTYAGLLQDLKRLIAAGPAEIQLEVLKILPGTLLKARAPELGIQFSPCTPYDVMQTPAMPVAHIVASRKLSRWVDLFYNHPILQKTTATACGESPTFVEDFMDYIALHTDMLKAVTPSLDARMKLLWEYLSRQTWPAESVFELSKAWMRMANTPGKDGCPARNAIALPCLPDGATLVSGNPTAALADMRTRFWMLPHPAHPAFFAYNRAIAPNRAAAEWRQ